MMRTAFGALLVALGAVALAQEGPPPRPSATAAPVLSPTLDRKIREARASGAWLVEEGETFYTIGRLFAADEAEALVIAREFRALNPGVGNGGDLTTLQVGARLRLPPRLAVASATVLAPGTLPDKVSPPRGEDRATVVGPPVYVDNLIGGEAAEEAEAREQAVARDASPGLRSIAIELRLDRRTQSFGGLAIAEGLAVRHRVETERFGDFTFEAEAGRERGGNLRRGQGARSVGRATLFHDQFAVTDALVATSALGAVRLGPSPWLGSSDRIQLPSTIASGVTTQLDAPRYQLRGAYGRLARLGGVTVQDLDVLPGNIAMLEASTRLSEAWRVGGAVTSLQGAINVPDHVAATVAAEWGTSVTPRFKFQALADDRGEAAFWGTGEARHGRFTQRFGAYHVDPRVLFGDSTLPRDTRGAFWRGEQRGAAQTTTFGAELLQSNLDRDPARGGLTSVGAFSSVSLRLDRSTNVGGGLSLREEQPRTDRGMHRTVGLASAFVSRVFPIGVSRLDASYNGARNRGLATEATTTFSYSHEWPRWGGITASTVVTTSDERLLERRVRRNTASLALRGPAYASVQWDATYTFVDIEDPESAQRNYNAAIGLDWTPARDWVVRLQWLRNQVEPTTPNTLVPFVRENVLQLSARYEETSGTPYPRVGGAGGRSGTGWIEGVVFFDENGDGSRQPQERGAPGVTVILDGRSAQVTDAGGRFNFALVGSGDHSLTLSVERVPLPWGLQDEAPRPVRVEVRAGTRIDLPLNRITP